MCKRQGKPILKKRMKQLMSLVISVVPFEGVVKEVGFQDAIKRQTW